MSFPAALAGLAYAARVHAGQRREADGAPFILHPLEVASLLYHAGAPDHLIAAGMLHDTIEKTHAHADDLNAGFGQRIATLVLAVSQDERIIDYQERKAALREQVATAGREALMIFAADKISKARDLRRDTAVTRPAPGHPSHASDARLSHYRDCARLLEEHLPQSPLTGKLHAELEKSTSIAHDRSLLPETPSIGGRQ